MFLSRGNEPGGSQMMTSKQREMTEEFHRLAKHAGDDIDSCQTCIEQNERQASANRRFRKHQQQLTERVRRIR